MSWPYNHISLLTFCLTFLVFFESLSEGKVSQGAGKSLTDKHKGVVSQIQGMGKKATFPDLSLHLLSRACSLKATDNTRNHWKKGLHPSSKFHLDKQTNTPQSCQRWTQIWDKAMTSFAFASLLLSDPALSFHSLTPCISPWHCVRSHTPLPVYQTHTVWVGGTRRCYSCFLSGGVAGKAEDGIGGLVALFML